MYATYILVLMLTINIDGRAGLDDQVYHHIIVIISSNVSSFYSFTRNSRVGFYSKEYSTTSLLTDPTMAL
jgi:hypothetical protein